LGQLDNLGSGRAMVWYGTVAIVKKSHIGRMWVGCKRKSNQ